MGKTQLIGGRVYTHTHVALQDPDFLQWTIYVLVEVFEHVDLETNVKKMQAMTCMPGKIRLQLPANSYCQMRGGYTSAADWEARTVTCRECGKNMRASSLSHHLADLHEIYQQQVVAKELLDKQQGAVYRVGEGYAGTLCRPFPSGKMASGWMIQRHFRDVHPLDFVVLPKEGRYLHCPRCGMQVNPR